MPALCLLRPSGSHLCLRVAKVKVGGIISNDHLARISVMGVPDRPGTAAALLAVFGETGVNVAFIVQCIDQRGQDHIVFCVDRSDLEVSCA